MRVTFVITNLECGGAERRISIMSNYWAAKGWEVTVITFDDGSQEPFFELDPRVRLLPLGIYQATSSLPARVSSNLARILRLRRSIRETEPEVVISFLYFVNVLVLLATRGLGLPVLVVETSDPEAEPKGGAWAWFRRWTYSFKALVVVPTARARSHFSPDIQSRTTVIPNPVTPAPPEGAAPPEDSPPRPSLVAMGSLRPYKGFDLLLEAFSRLKESHPEWSLTIYGEGPERARLEALRDELGLEGRVRLPGRVKNPHGVLPQADLFVLPSRREGYPMVLIEALSCGLPAVAADCRFGPREILRDGVDGVLVPPEDPEALAEAMGRLMSEEKERRRLSQAALEINERYSLDKVMGVWEDLLSSASLAGQGRRAAPSGA